MLHIKTLRTQYVIIILLTLVLAFSLVFSLVIGGVVSVFKTRLETAQRLVAENVVQQALEDPASIDASVLRGVDGVLDAAIRNTAQITLPRSLPGTNALILRIDTPHTIHAFYIQPTVIRPGEVDGISLRPLAPDSRQLLRTLYVAVQIGPNRWAEFIVEPRISGWPPPQPLVILFFACAVLLGLISIWLAGHVTRPFEALTQAAERLAAGQTLTPLTLSGTDDIRRTQRAFNTMAARLQASIASQQAVLAAIGHDLRTPLTTLRVRLSMLENEHERQQVTSALGEFERLAEAALHSVERPSSEAASIVDLASVVGSVCDNLAEAGASLDDRTGDQLALVEGWSHELVRLFRNLIENALRYGSSAIVSMTISEPWVTVDIDDSGPGIPVDKLDSVFEPFVRLDVSRASEHGGFGLGLHIAKHLAESHGGNIVLCNLTANTGSNTGGLRARVTLPLASSLRTRDTRNIGR